VYWVVTSSSSIGNPTALFDAGWAYFDPLLDGVYIWEGNCEPIGGGGNYDDCSGAIALACGDSVVGETLTATDSGGNAAPDVFYKFTGSGTSQLVTISLCGGGTDYDSLLRVFDDCDLLNELAFNDDSCGLQSEVTFVSDGTSTYYIMVEGFGSASGNFSLDVTCEDPLPNDDCSGAIAVNCGDSVTGSNVGATIDNAPTCGTPITSPGVWYSLDDNSGLPGDITLSLCNGTDFDSKISVYSGTCPALVCVGGNDDACGLQSEITFASDGNTKYYILIHSFGGATGNFTMDVTCTPTPPPNDMIVNSIDVDEIGFPYTDPSVAMPAATTEDGNPVNCDLTGANGVWYNFVPAGDGTATAMIVTPGGASSVTFYTAPDENAVETDLTLVPQQSNQCAPGTSASIFTLGGQAYYVFVMNTGAITDIVIDGTNLGVSDNTIAGFSYYPNPTNGILNLKSVDNIEHVSIYNLLGQLVVDNRVNATASQVDISGLSTGTYLMKVTVNGETGTYKVLKQ
ncbi:T9SS type A sorting domain-containing protein, partial [Aequorivita antarctica]